MLVRRHGGSSGKTKLEREKKRRKDKGKHGGPCTFDSKIKGGTLTTGGLLQRIEKRSWGNTYTTFDTNTPENVKTKLQKELVHIDFAENSV